MLQNLTNFFNLIRNRKIKTQLENDDLIAVGTRDFTWNGNYQPTAITYQDLAAQIGGGGGGGQLTLTVNGVGGAASLFGNTLNIPFIPAGGVAINGSQAFGNIVFGPSSLVTTSGNVVTLKPEIPYKAYRAKIAMQTIDWPGYGYLYNWYAVDDIRGLANPTGGTGLSAPNKWRVPSNTDWDTLAAFAGGSSVAGGKLKSTLTSTGYPFNGWLSNGGGTDDYNFSGLPGGRRFDAGQFDLIGNNGLWWSSFTNSPTTAFIYIISSLSGVLGSFPISKGDGCSVRLVREATAGELLLADGDTSDTSSLDPYTGNDGKTYVTVKIGTQIWLAQNLRETKYNDNSDIFNASVLFGGDFSYSAWEAKGIAQEGAWTAYRFNADPGFSGIPVEYDPTTIKLFYNDVLENTLGLPVPSVQPLWAASQDVNGPFYTLSPVARPWNKTHIKVTPGYDVSDFPTINERSLLIERAVENESIIIFRPIKRSNTGALTIEDLNNYNDIQGVATSYVYVEILEYQESYYYSSSLAAGMGVGNL